MSYKPMTLKYVGRKPLPYELRTPIPYIAHSDWDGGTLSFNPTCFVKEKYWVEWLLTACGDVFEPVAETPPPVEEPQPVEPTPQQEEEKEPEPEPAIAAQSPYIGRKFMGKAGKWNAIAFLRKKQLVKSLGIHRIDGGWELVAVTAPEAEGVTDKQPVTA